MPYTIALVKPESVENNDWAATYPTELHRFSWRWPEEYVFTDADSPSVGRMNVCERTELEMSNADDTYLYEDLEPPFTSGGDSENVVRAIEKVLLYGGFHHNDIIQLLLKWAIDHPEGKWRVG